MQIASAFIGIMAAQAQRKAYQMEAAAYREQAEMSKIEAAQKENERNRKLRLQLASLGTSMSAQGVALGTSPSVLALADDEERIAASDIASIRLMGQSQRRRYELSASGSEAAGSAAMLGGFMKSAGTFYSANKGVG